MKEIQTPSDIAKYCRERAFYAYGTYRIFENRALNLRWKRNAITFLGILVPVVVGGLILSFGTMPKLLPYILGVAGIVGIIQLVFSVWSLVARWDEQHSYATSSMLANTRLFNSWGKLASSSVDSAKQGFAELEAEDGRQEQTDLAQHITPKEKRFAMRASLQHMGSSCVMCGIKPTSMKPSSCDNCGNF